MHLHQNQWVLSPGDQYARSSFPKPVETVHHPSRKISRIVTHMELMDTLYACAQDLEGDHPRDDAYLQSAAVPANLTF